jgi:hypothetical protein
MRVNWVLGRPRASPFWLATKIPPLAWNRHGAGRRSPLDHFGLHVAGATTYSFLSLTPGPILLLDKLLRELDGSGDHSRQKVESLTKRAILKIDGKRCGDVEPLIDPVSELHSEERVYP